MPSKRTSPRKRAPRNRTLVLSRSDRKRLLPLLLTQPPKRQRTKPVAGIVCGDYQDWVRFLPRNSVDLLMLDPPYNLTKSFGALKFAARTENKYTLWLQNVIRQLIPLLKKTASIYICGDWRTSLSIMKVAQEFFYVRNRITWEREKGRGAKSNWKNAHEDIWFCTMSSAYTFHVDQVKHRRRVIAPYRNTDGTPKDWDESREGNYRDTHPANLWNDLSVPFWSMTENTDHPTQKPEKLVAKLLLASSNPGDYVFDPFGGSGTTAVVASKLQRQCLSIDLNQQYGLWALKRLEMAKQDQSIQGYEDGVFWQRNAGK
ncbi:MAG: site-specific DNA-methyltransferase [Planctomycetaceae bacterium]|nr:site-specific DNA-methyltransferase [Planctomycetaceae bacterium]